MEREIKVHVGVTQDELSAYLTDNDEEWGEDIENHFYDATDREVVTESTFFADDAGYLENLVTVIETYPAKVMKWLTITCPVCGAQPGEDDTAHQMVSYIVGIACNGMRVVDPGQVWMDSTGWMDWTEGTPVHASRKASN